MTFLYILTYCFYYLTNLSVLKTNKGKAIRFSTLNKLCKVLECMPGDILDYQDKGDEEEYD